MRHRCNIVKIGYVAVAMGIMILSGARDAGATIMAFFNFNDMPTLANGTTNVTKEHVFGVPTLTMVQQGGSLQGLSGVTATGNPTFVDQEGTSHVSGFAAGWSATTTDSYWLLDLDASNYVDMTIRFDNRSSGAGSTSLTLAWAVNGGAFTDITTFTLNRNSTFTAYSADLSAISAIENVASLQLRGTWGPDGTAPNTRLDNVQLTGTQIPEPSAIVLLCLGACAIGSARWVHRSRADRSA